MAQKFGIEQLETRLSQTAPCCFVGMAERRVAWRWIYFGRCRETQRVSHLLPVWRWPLEGTIGSSRVGGRNQSRDRFRVRERRWGCSSRGFVAFPIYVTRCEQCLAVDAPRKEVFWGRGVLLGWAGDRHLPWPRLRGTEPSWSGRPAHQVADYFCPCPKYRTVIRLYCIIQCNPVQSVAFRLRSQRCRGQERLHARSSACFQIASTVLLLSHTPKHPAFPRRKLEQKKTRREWEKKPCPGGNNYYL